MPDLKSQLELSADATGVETGVGRAKKSLASLGATATTEGARAAAGIERIGAGGDAAAAKVDRSTRSLINSIQRTTAALDAGGKSSSGYFAALASQRGVDPGALKPYLDQLDAVRVRQAAATQELSKGGIQFNKYGLSVKQNAAALRQVPAQLTDIIVGLQGGQAPLTVLLQQGGQLKDVFGGVVPAARALGGAVVGLINPFTLTASAVAALGFAYFQGSKESDAFAKSLILTGNAAGTTVGQLTAMAQRISDIVGTQASASEALAKFAANGNIAGGSIERFTTIALRMEKVTGQAVDTTVKQFAELAKSPLDASVKLNEATNFLTNSLYKQIRALEEQGRTAEAAAVAQKALADASENSLNRLESRLGLIERTWDAVGMAAKKAWGFMLNVGRPTTLQDQLSAAEAQLEARLQSGGPRRGSMTNQGQYDQATQALRDRVETMKESLRLEGSVADRQRESATQVKARIAFDKEGEQFLSNRVKMEKAIAEARNQGLAAGASQVEIEKRIAAIREKYTTKKSTSGARLIDRAELGLDLQAIKAASEQLLGTYANSERIIEAIRSAGLLGDREYYESKRGFIKLEAQAKEDALKAEMARLGEEKLAGKDKLDNERKIAEAVSKLAMVRADASSRLVVLSIQEEAAQKRVALSYLSAQQAAQDYLDTINRQQNRSLAGIGQGSRQRERDTGINQIEDRYADQRRDLENNRAQLELEGKFTEEARKQYEDRLSIINEFQSKSIASFLAYFDRLQVAQSNWKNGASEAVYNYLADVQNVSKQAEEMFTNAFRGMEDALVKFITTGKLDFKSLADSILVDITRIVVKQQLMAPLVKALGLTGGGSGGGLGSFLGSLIGGGRAIGGPVSAGRMYEVNERKQPEILNVGNKQFLMMGNKGGSVSPAAGGGGNTVNVTINQSFAPGTTRQTTSQAAVDARRQLEYAGRNM